MTKSKTFVLEKKKTGIIELTFNSMQEELFSRTSFRMFTIGGFELRDAIQSLKEGDRIELKIVKHPLIKCKRLR